MLFDWVPCLISFWLADIYSACCRASIFSWDLCFFGVVFFPSSFWPWLCGGEVGLLWIGVREGQKAVRVPRVATLVLLDRRPLQLPPFLEGAGFGKLVLCSSLPL